MHLAESGIETPGSKIPANYKGEDGQQGVIRVVEIEGLGDANPCVLLWSLSSIFKHRN